jgi:hypothetical protein
MATQIEYPEDPVPKAHFLAETETVATIGQLYDAVITAFQENSGEIPYDQTNQQSGPLGLNVIGTIDAATSAMKLIQQQGEGGAKIPFPRPACSLISTPLVNSITCGNTSLTWPSKQETGTDDKIVIGKDDVYPMTPVPLGGYVSPPPEVIDVDRIFTQMLQHLEAAWTPGGKKELSAAIQLMRKLTPAATALLSKQIPRTGATGIYGPQFRLNTSI